ncbi:MAG: esterase/lipase family protein, partial [Patescibacteria group bacterium]
INGDEIVNNYKIDDNFIEFGTIGLKVSTGATYPSEVYFDDIRVTKINPPVVLIPGHGASFNFREMFLNQPDPDGWQMTPGVRVYDNILASLEANGYKEGEDLFVFNYNWLNSISGTASHLYDFIENIVDSSSFSGVRVIGHSMGGLVGRACFQEQDNECFIDQLISVGSPHRGVLEAYGAWEGGEIWRDGLTRLAFETFLNIQKQPLETNKEALRRLSPSLAEMLPDFAYLKDSQGEEISFNEEDYPKNLFLERVGPVIGDKNNFIFGQEQPTWRWLKVSEDFSWADQFLNNWEHGKPIEKEFSNQGDGTVLALSAYPDENLSGRFFNLGHRETIADPIAVAEIITLLDLEPQAGLEFLANEENYLVFYLHSPAHLEISSLSEEVGFWEDDLGPKLIIIANPELEKDYLVDVVGDESGRYRLTVGKIYNSDSSWRHYDGFIEPGQTDTFKANLNNFIEVTTTGSIHPIEELLEDLKTFANGLLEEKVVGWQELFGSSHQQALVYGYQLRSWLSLSTKNSTLETADLLLGLAKIESIISYLEELALADNQEIDSLQLDPILSFWSQELSGTSSLPNQNNSLSRLAALDYLASNDYYSLLSGNQNNYEKLIYSLSGIGSLVNSQILLQDN